VDSSPFLENREALAALVAEYGHGRVPKELRRRQILGVATDLFIESGFSSVSMDEIARRVGVSKPVVYDAFGSKEELFHEVVAGEVRRLGARVEAAVDAEPDPTQKLRSGTLAFFRFIGERRAAWRALMAYPEAPMSIEIAGARRTHARTVATLLARAAVETGKPVEPIILDAVAHAINGANEALALWWHEHPEFTPEALSEIVTQLVAPGLLALSV
jgi:AcrR family transcriptional regulator